MPQEVRNAYVRFFRQVTAEAGINYNSQAPGMATANMMNEMFTDEANRLFANNRTFGAGVSYFNPTTETTTYAGKEFQRLEDEYKKAMEDNFMKFDEKNALMEIVNNLSNDRKYSLTDDDSLLLSEIKALILSNKEVSDKLGNATNAIKNDNST